MAMEITHAIKWKVSDEELEAAGVSKEAVMRAIDGPLLLKVTEFEPPCMVDGLYDNTKVAFAYVEGEDKLHLVYGSVTMSDDPEEPVYWEPDRQKIHKMFTKDFFRITTRLNKYYREMGWDVPDWSFRCDYFSACVVAGEGLASRVHRNIEFPDLV